MAKPPSTKKPTAKPQTKAAPVSKDKGGKVAAPAAKAAGKDAKDAETKKKAALAGGKAAPAGKIAKAPAKGSKVAGPKDDDDGDGFEGGDDDDDDDFAPPAAKAGKGKPGPAGKSAKGPRPEDLVDMDDDAVPPLADLVDDDDDELGDRTPRRSLASDADAAALEAEGRVGKKGRGAGGANGGATTAKDKLIELGKQKGFVTYDEVNDAMPEDVVSTDQIDSWLSALGDHGIEVVDGAGGRRAGDIVDQAPKGLELE